MEDILASIRETVEEEVSKADEAESATSTEETNSQDDIASELLSEDISDDEGDDITSEDDALAAMANAQSEIDNAANTSDNMDDEDMAGLLSETDDATETVAEVPASTEESNEDVLELTDVVEKGDTSSEDDLIDVNKFASSGEIAQAEASDVAASRESYGAEGSEDEDDIDVDLDGIMNELKEEGEIPSADDLPSEDEAASFIAENNVEESEQSDDADALDMMSSSEDEIQETVEKPTAPVTPEAPATPAVSEQVAQAAAEEVARKVFLPTTPSAKGLQVSFPAEVLAEALRPLVTDWINQNLGDIVERLVKEEISKLVDR